MIDGSLKFIVVPIETRFIPFGINACTILILKLASQRSYAENIDWRVREIQDIVGVNGVSVARVISPSPSHSTHSVSIVLIASNCCYKLPTRASWWLKICINVVAYVNIGAVVTNDGRGVSIKACCGVLTVPIYIQN